MSKKGRPRVPKISIDLVFGKGKIAVTCKGKHFHHAPGERPPEQQALWDAMTAALRGITAWEEQSASETANASRSEDT